MIRTPALALLAAGMTLMLLVGCTRTQNAPAPQSMPTLDSHVAGFAMAYCLRTLDNKGFARVAGFEPGQCKVSFPTLDQDAWTDA